MPTALYDYARRRAAAENRRFPLREPLSQPDAGHAGPHPPRHRDAGKTAERAVGQAFFGGTRTAGPGGRLTRPVSGALSSAVL